MNPPVAGRLPIHHPDYRYPPSRNPYWQKNRDLAGRVYGDNDTEAHRGGWRELFPDRQGSGPGREAAPGGRRTLHLEIGCNAGHVTVEWAARNPADAYIGLDCKFKAVFRGADKARARGLGNLMFFRANADRLAFMFGKGEVDHAYLFFPDPWPKKSQWKNRFVSPRNLSALAEIVRPGGTLEIKTDHPGYFDWMEAALREVQDLWDVRERTTDLHQNHPEPTKLAIPEVTLFEKLFIKDKIPIHRLGVTRRPQS